VSVIFPTVEPGHWTKEDETRAHGMSIIILASALEDLMRCHCVATLGYASYMSDRCSLCGRKRPYPTNPGESNYGLLAPKK